MIEVRKLAAIDMLWLGPRIVIAEYALESGCPLRWEPLFLHAVSLVRAGTVEQEGRAALVHLAAVQPSADHAPGPFCRRHSSARAAAVDEPRSGPGPHRPPAARGLALRRHRWAGH